MSARLPKSTQGLDYHTPAGLFQPASRREPVLVEREFFLAWLRVRRSHIELMSLESNPRWPVFVGK